MGISIVLYRIPAADKPEVLNLNEAHFDKSKSVNLYKITQDLGMVFMNTADPFSNKTSLQHKMLFGNFVRIQTGDRVTNGFISAKEVKDICKWIRNAQLNSKNGFDKLYDELSPEVKQELYEIGADEKDDLYNGYVVPLVNFYLEAERNDNAVIFCGE